MYVTLVLPTRTSAGLFLDIVKKTQAQKNSKLKQNLEKTQKPPTPVEFRWWNFFYKPLSFPHVVNFLNCKFESTVQILQSQYFFTHNTDILIKLCRNWKGIKEAHGAKFYRFNSLDLPKKLKELLVKKLKTQGKPRKNSRQNPQKTKKPPTPVELSCQKNVQK